jgi:hypothetical protein
MKKQLLTAMFFIIASALSAQETLTGWTFPAISGADSLNANLGTTQNMTYDIRFQWVLTPTTDSTLNTITFVNGATTFAAAATGWDNGADIKFWSIKFKANNYNNFKVSSKQRSDATNPGPRDFKLQWRLSSGTYADIPGGTVTLGSDWTTGVITDLPVPITDQGTSSIYIRWIMSTNTDINGGTVAATGQSMIDDILVTGVSTSGQNEILYTNRLKLFPSPNNGTFTLSSTEPLDIMTISDQAGKTIYIKSNPLQNQQVSIPGAKSGVYFLKVRFSGSDQDVTTRFIVE